MAIISGEVGRNGAAKPPRDGTLPSRPRPSRSNFFVSFAFKCCLLGGTLDFTRFGRNANELDCVNAFIPDEVWRELLATTNAYLATAASTKSPPTVRHYALTTENELKKVFFARLDLICRGISSIEQGFAKVPFPLGFLSSPRTPSAPGIPLCRDFIPLMVI